MKKIFEYIGISALFIFSLIFTEKTATVLKEQDEIMIKIREVEKEYYIEPKEATIVDNTIIPGLSGQKINVSDSYYKMKKVGLFNETLLILDTIKPKQELKKNKDKFIIGGNKNKKEVSLIFITKDSENIENTLEVLSQNKVKANFFVTGSFMENNNTMINNISKNHLIGNLSYNMDYKNSDFIWMSTIIKKFNDNYCYTETLNKEVLEICERNKSYTVVPTTIIKNKPLMNISKKLNNGDIISFYMNNEILKELDIVIKEIKSKGYEIVKLDELLLEK